MVSVVRIVVVQRRMRDLRVRGVVTRQTCQHTQRIVGQRAVITKSGCCACVVVCEGIQLIELGRDLLTLCGVPAWICRLAREEIETRRIERGPGSLRPVDVEYRIVE